MLSNPTSADTLRFVRQALDKSIGPELQSDTAKVVFSMVQGVLASVERRIAVEQQYMADECNRMTDFVAKAAHACSGIPGQAADTLAGLATQLPPSELPQLPPFAEINVRYRDVSDLFTEALGALHTLAGQGADQAAELIDEARQYIALRLSRDNVVFAMDGGLIGK
ncbi:MAG: hypothetical protein ACKVVT_04125 [Dehalococcoidia bacterium]